MSQTSQTLAEQLKRYERKCKQNESQHAALEDRLRVYVEKEAQWNIDAEKMKVTVVDALPIQPFLTLFESQIRARITVNLCSNRCLSGVIRTGYSYVSNVLMLNCSPTPLIP